MTIHNYSKRITLLRYRVNGISKALISFEASESLWTIALDSPAFGISRKKVENEWFGGLPAEQSISAALANSVSPNVTDLIYLIHVSSFSILGQYSINSITLLIYMSLIVKKSDRQ